MAVAIIDNIKDKLGNIIYPRTKAKAVYTESGSTVENVLIEKFFSASAASEYNPSGTYAVGDYCTHGGKLHKCGTAIPSGEAWNAEHWTATTVAAELAGKANATPPQKVQLPLEDGFSSNGVYENYFVKTQENIVHVSFCFMKGEGDIRTGEVVATLPVGCRPAVETARSVGADGIDFGTGIFSAQIHIRTNGEIFLWGINAKAKWLYGEFFLLAEN